jgi:hypothetical protein
MSRHTEITAIVAACVICCSCGAGQKRNEQAGEKLDEYEARVQAGKLKVACTKGDMTACTDLGGMLMLGEEVAADYDQAYEYLDKACQADEAKACTNLGYLCQKGPGAYVSMSKARKLYEKGCLLGEPKALPGGTHPTGLRCKVSRHVILILLARASRRT